MVGRSVLKEGKYFEAEELIKDKSNLEIKKVWKSILEQFIPRRETRDIANRIGSDNNYLRVELRKKTITIGGGIAVKASSHYALSKRKKMGPKKAVANGRGTHILLSYWGDLLMTIPLDIGLRYQGWELEAPPMI